MSEDDLPDEHNLDTHPYFLVPIMLQHEKMFMWYSVCSKHRSHNSECPMCNAGSWYEIVMKEGDDGIPDTRSDDG